MKIIWTQSGPVISSLNADDGAGDGGEAGGGPAAPAPEPTPEPADGSGGSEVDFSALAAEMESDENDDEPADPAQPEETPAAESAPAQPEAPAQPAEAQPETPPAGEQPAAGEEPAAAEPAAETAAPEPLTPEKIEEAYQSYHDQIMPQLEEQYKLTEEQVNEINDNPAAAIPKLAAKIHYQAQMAAYTGIMSQMPRVVSSVMERARAVEKAEDQFFSRWPDLNKKEHRGQVDATLRAWRSANPNATMDEMIEKAGVMAMLSLGLDPNAGAPDAGGEAQAGAAPAAGQQPPATPAGTGGSGPARQPGQGGGGNIFEEMADEMLEEDL